MTNETCVKHPMAPQSYKVVITHAHKISVRNSILRLIHSRVTHLGDMNGDFQSDIATLVFKNGEQLEYFHRRVLILQQEIMLSGETFSPTRLLFQYMKVLSKSDKTKAFVAPNTIDLITYLDNNGKYTVYTGGYISVIYSYLDINGSQTTLNTSGHRSHHLSPSSTINNAI